MQLLNATTLQLEEFYGSIPDYAILSHRWEQEEVTYQDVKVDRAMSLKGWPKLVSCCRIAVSRGLQYVWIDTCCIDKSSSAELTESINSVYLWYGQAEECYVFLSNVRSRSLDTDLGCDDFTSSAWFTRGWTLQELIAPAAVFFYNRRWQYLACKAEISELLHSTTLIGPDVLRGNADLSRYSIAQRMSWAAGRVTTRPEDEAYCLLGIFGVNMPMLYGEGKNAFRRLQEEIIKQSDDQTLFTWHDDLPKKSGLAPSPSCLAKLHDLKCMYPTNDLRFGHTLSNSGLSIKLMLIPWTMNTYVAPLSCGRVLAKDPESQIRSTRGYHRLGIFLRQTQYHNHLVRVSYGGIDTVLLNSDIVASKRNDMAIENRQVFLRQSLVDMPPQLFFGFSCSFSHTSMFKCGIMRNGLEIEYAFVRRSEDEIILILGDYEHFAAGCFYLSGLESAQRPLFMYLGFDLDFAPLCLVTTRAPGLLVTKDGSITKLLMVPGDHLAKEKVPLAWLLSEIAAGESSHTILAFRGRSNASTEVHCKKLALKIQFEIRPSETLKQPVWHVSFGELSSDSPNHPSSPSASTPTISESVDKSLVKKQRVSYIGRAWARLARINSQRQALADSQNDTLSQSLAHTTAFQPRTEWGNSTLPARSATTQLHGLSPSRQRSTVDNAVIMEPPHAAPPSPPPHAPVPIESATRSSVLYELPADQLQRVQRSWSSLESEASEQFES